MLERYENLEAVLAETEAELQSLKDQADASAISSKRQLEKGNRRSSA